MLDQITYIEPFTGKVRHNTERGAVVYDVIREEGRPGGAACASEALRRLAAKVTLVGVIGRDDEGELLKELCRQRGVDTFLVDDGRPTTVKKRCYVADPLTGRPQYIAFRLDREVIRDIDLDIVRRVESFVAERINSVDAIFLSDFDKGMVTPPIVETVSSLALARRKPLLVGAKHQWDKYRKWHVGVITATNFEANSGAGIDLEMATELREGSALGHLLCFLNSKCDVFLVILDGEGTMIVERGKPEVLTLSGLPVRGRLVTTVHYESVFNAFYLGARLLGYPLQEAVAFGNFAAGLKVERLDEDMISISDLIAAIKSGRHVDITVL